MAHIWHKPAIDAIKGGELFENWLYKAKTNDNIRLLIICGAGVSMSGVAPGSPGRYLGKIFADYLRYRTYCLPTDLDDNVAALYEYYCYGFDLDPSNPLFDRDRHAEFVDCIYNGSFLNGSPNYSHLTLDKEVKNSNLAIRIYSVNVDQFFRNVDINPTLYPSWGSHTINAADIVGNQLGCNEHRDWEILAAHGQISSGSSVWSNMALSHPLSRIPRQYTIEKNILAEAVNCINYGPLYNYVIFAGICAPLVYLMKPLCKRLIQTGVNWLWVNPYDCPQKWLLKHPAFNNGNGEWVQSTFDEVCFNMHFKRYIAWLNTSCRTDKYDYKVCVSQPEGKRKDIVRGIHRARRLYKDGAEILNTAKMNPDRLEEYHKCEYPFDPPVGTMTTQFEDSCLAKILCEFSDRKLRVTPDPGDQYPRCSIVINTDTNRTSAQMIKMDIADYSIENIAEGIVKIVSECYWDNGVDPDLLHLVVIDSSENDVITLNQHFTILLKTSPYNPPNTHIIHYSELSGLSCDFSELRGRPVRP